MRRTKTYPTLTKQIFYPEIRSCLSCGTRLRRYATLSERTVITLAGGVRMIHYGCRCPNPTCATRTRSYRSAQADALALPGFTFGLEIVVLVGQLRLAHHLTLDQTHQAVQARLTPLGLTISRREVLYLFEAYCTLVRASQQLAADAAWQAQVRAGGGLILAIDGIQPDKGQETVYLVRDVLTGRVLAAENVRCSDVPTLRALLQPIQALDLPVLAAISDAQASIRQAVSALWPQIPHQVCQFHYLREASRPLYEANRTLRKEIRKAIQQPVRTLRTQLGQRIAKLDSADQATTVAQLQILDDYALAVQTAINLDGQQPFRYASLALDDALGEIATSLAQLEKGGP